MAFQTYFSLGSFLEQVNKLTENQRNSIKKVGFGNLLHIPNHTLARSQLSKLMDKWSPEKQTFLFPFGELSITLLDVSLILGLRVIGQPVVLLEGAPLTNLEKEFGASFSKRAIKVESLKERLEDLGERDDDDFVRAFLLYCFGKLLFPSANGNVDSRYLSVLQDLDEVSSFAWGAAVLEEIHDCLTQRKSKRTNNVRGCVILLQIWCYEHIVTRRPKLLDCPSTFPRICRWENIRQYTIKLDELEHSQILWKLQPTSEEIQIDIIKEIPQIFSETRTERYLRTRPGTLEEPINVGSASVIRRPRAHKEEENKEENLKPVHGTIEQDESTIFVISDDDESKLIEDLKQENLELKATINKLTKDKEDMKNEIEELRKLVEKLRSKDMKTDNTLSILEKMVLDDNVDL